ncbi:4-methylaminobutanoate oxidase (formaldehyde-forming) [Candidatus Thermoflexus japonica]|uniref:4-methylaminobutanoate oxidase (Formaldehyde-forming) n=1 Tax=Candidatus Thermoflexus japonica TaxID=2035417 RepID=A0A2H5Y3H3_9CHLR|nr:4-methylaminobutanoate oxidase (formaldehyde-forming) [Candidatus Thermoflexus japonica]
MGPEEVDSGAFPRTADLVIIGGGIAGVAAAFYATREGFRTVVVERKPWLGALTTAVAVACFRAQWDDPDFAYLMVPSIATYERFADEIGVPGYDIGLRQQGWLFATTDPRGLERFQQWVEGQRRLGITDTELWTGEEARRRFPWLSSDVTAATFRARDGWLSPHEVVYGYARASGATFLLETEAPGIRVTGGRVAGVETLRGFLAAPRVVIAAGPFSRRLVTTAGVDLPLFLLRRQRAFVADPAIPPDAPMVADDDTGVYWRPEAGGAFLGWGLPEPPGEPQDPVPADPLFPARALEGAARLTPFFREVAARLTRDRVSVAAGQYTCTPDGKPLIGGCPPVDGLYVLTGDNGYGIESAPQAARHLVEVLTGRLPEPENRFRVHRPFRPTGKKVL